MTSLHSSSLALLPLEQQRQILAALNPAQCTKLQYDWPFWARPEQLPPAGDWRTWVYLGGRGAGKTRAGAEWVRCFAESGKARRIALVAPTAADARDVIVEGESGILAIAPPWARPQYEPSKRRLTWPNGAIATTYSAEEPERLRGPQHDLAWADEVAAWAYPQTWDMLMLGLRLGDPRCCVTTTPRPTELLAGSGREGRRLGLLRDPQVAKTIGTTYDNRANLAPEFLSQIIRRYEGTRQGRQELLAELLEDVPGALWTRDMIDRTRLGVGMQPELVRIVVAIDPAVTSGEDADETGIVVAGKDDRGHGYVLADRSGHYAPAEWARIAIGLYRDLHADRIVAEVNQGGEMVEHTIRMIDDSVPYTAVRASGRMGTAHSGTNSGKYIRAEPVAALYEQGRVHHLGALPQLEDQMCGFVPDIDRKQGSPDRVDALVWALTELIVEPLPSQGMYDLMRQKAAEAKAARNGNGIGR